MSKTPQTSFWQGEFGDAYTARNTVPAADRQAFFARILQRTVGVISICELGANRGHNLAALQALSPNFRLTGVDVNRKAVDEMAALPSVDARCSPIQDFQPEETFDLVFVCGVLIHIGPTDLPAVYERMFALSRRYVLLNEYFNPVPVEVEYRGHAGKLFKRDFGAEFLDRFASRIRLVDYGFLWKRREPAWDNTTWWLFEKGG